MNFPDHLIVLLKSAGYSVTQDCDDDILSITSPDGETWLMPAPEKLQPEEVYFQTGLYLRH